MLCKAGTPGIATVCSGLMVSICRVPSENDVLRKGGVQRALWGRTGTNGVIAIFIYLWDLSTVI